MAKIYSSATLISATWSAITLPSSSSGGPNGIAAKATKAKKTEKNGAIVCSSLLAPSGTRSSLVNILIASAMPWNRPSNRNPKMSARLAPIRSWIRADCFRSTQV